MTFRASFQNMIETKNGNSQLPKTSQCRFRPERRLKIIENDKNLNFDLLALI